MSQSNHQILIGIPYIGFPRKQNQIIEIFAIFEILVQYIKKNPGYFGRCIF